MPASEFSDVFISYRRLDVEFVKRLVGDLQAVGKEVWIDWEDIPPGVEGFADEIKRGIEGADAFVAVLTPDYLESTYCVDMELQYAVDLQKKIIPIVLSKFDEYPIPQGISHINWIYFTPHAGQENSYEEAYPKILDVMQTDLEHVRQHKRFLLRAIEWDENNREASFLLNGEEIENAQNWLTHSAGKEPIPNDLHREYITSSINLRQRQQRLILSGVTVALVISVILSILSFIGFNDASIAQSTAVANLDIASTAQFEAEANEALASTARANAEASANLAQTAQAEAETSANLAQIAQAEAEKNLRDSRQSQSLFHGDLAQQQASQGLYQRSLLLALEALKFHQEGIVSDSAYGAIHAALHQPIRQTFHVNFPTGILSTIWHENRQQVLIATDVDNTLSCDTSIDCTIRVEIWDFMEQELEAYLPHDYPLSIVLWHQTNEQVLTLSYDDVNNQSRIILWDAEEQTELYRVDSDQYIDWIIWQDGHNYFITGQKTQFSCGFGDQPSCNHQAVVYDSATGEQVAEYPQDFEVVSGAFSPDNQFLEITVRQGFNNFGIFYDFASSESAGFYDKSLGHILWRDDEHRAILSTGEAIVAQPFGSVETLYSISSTQPFTVIDELLLVEQPEGCNSNCTDVNVYDALTGEARLTASHENSIVVDDLIQDGTYLLTRSNDEPDSCSTCQSAFYMWSFDTGELTHTFDYSGWIENGIGGYDLNSDETLLVTHVLNDVQHNMVQLWDIETGEELYSIDLDRTDISSIQFDASNQHLIIDYGDTVAIHDTASGILQHTLQLPEFLQEMIVLHDDLSIVTKTNTTINLWTVVDWQRTLRHPIGITITNEAYNRDKSQIITWSGNSRFQTSNTNAYVWDVETGKLLFTLETAAPVTDAEWSPNGREVAVLQWEQNCSENCASGTFIFDATTGEQTAYYDELGGAGTLRWYPESNQLIRMFDFMTIFDTQSGDIIYTSDTFLPSTNQWNSDYTMFAYQNVEDHSIQLVNYPSSEVLQTIPLTTQEYDTEWLNQDQTLVFLVDNDTSSATRIVAYDVDSSEELYSITNVGIFEPSNDKTQLMVYTEDRQLHHVDAATGDIIWSSDTLNEQWTDILWSPDDSKVILSGFYALQSQLFDVETGAQLNIFPYSRMEWSPNSDFILAEDDNVFPSLWRVYDVKSERVRFSFEPSSIPHWGRDSRQLVSHDGFWSVQFGDLIERGADQQIRALTDAELEEFFIKAPPDDPTQLSRRPPHHDEDEDEDEED